MRTEKYKSTDSIKKERYEQATDEQQYVFEVCWEMWDPRSVIPMEVGDWYDSTLKEDKDIHTVLDTSCAIDYLVDPFTAPPFGLNHRVHSPTDATLRFDLRYENNNQSMCELDALVDGDSMGDMVPKYGTRLKKSKNGIEWFRIVYLEPLIEAIRNGYRPDEYTGDDYTAWLVDYDVLNSMGSFVAEFDESGKKVFSEDKHECL